MCSNKIKKLHTLKYLHKTTFGCLLLENGIKSNCIFPLYMIVCWQSQLISSFSDFPWTQHFIFNTVCCCAKRKTGRHCVRLFTDRTCAIYATYRTLEASVFKARNKDISHSWKTQKIGRDVKIKTAVNLLVFFKIQISVLFICLY